MNVDTPWSIYTSHSVIQHGLHFCMCGRLIAVALYLLHYTYHAIPNEEWWTMSWLLAVWCALVLSVAESWNSH